MIRIDAIDKATRAAWREDPLAGLRVLGEAALRGDVGLALDCGDNSCRSPTRKRGGMRTNGGCRCDPIALAAVYVALALREIGRTAR